MSLFLSETLALCIAKVKITCFLQAVPDVASKLIDFEDIIRCTIEFETKLKDMMFISTDAKEEKLSQFVHDVEVHFALRKRSEILAKARNILVQYDYPDRPVSLTDQIIIFSIKKAIKRILIMSYWKRSQRKV